MKRLVLIFILALAMPQAALASGHEAAESKRIVAPSIDPEASCKICHEDVLTLRQALNENDAHAEIECIECHLGRRFNPHLPPELSSADVELTETFGGYFEHSPEIIAGCTDCHDDVTDAWQESIHGAGPETEEGMSRASCVSCHGPLHAITTDPLDKRTMAGRCIACHEFEEGEEGSTNPHVADTFRETIHGKMIALGNEKAAGCYDCHGGHGIYAIDNPLSMVHPDNRAETCRACHQNATESFTAAISHRPHSIDADFLSWATALFFSVLTVGTLLMLFVHLGLDLYHAVRNAFSKGDELHHGPDDVPLAADDEVERFDGHIRAQHAMMIISFVTLALTGWPLKSAAVGVSSDLARILGGQATLALLHRGAGALLMFLSVYHLVYIYKRWRSGKLSSEMVPEPKDLSDLTGNVQYYLGLRSDRPKFGKYTYYEKFDYWAIFWGVPLMVGTGLILWFPEIASNLIPGGLITLAFIAHSDEALLAVLAIFLWHFYNQHLRPAVFPMSWVWITGRITGEALYDEHRLTYEREYGQAPPRAPAHESAWHEHPVWSIAALAVVLVASVIVFTVDVASLSKEMEELGIREPTEGHVELVAETPEVIGVYDEEFDSWGLCFSCHNETRYESDEEHFPHKLHFEDEELDDECTGCHESVFHEKFITDREECLDCHEPEEIGMQEEGPGI